MQRPRPESKESAARTRSFSSTPRVDVIVLTTDTALLATLREAAGAGNELFPAESPESAVDLLVGGHCGIFVIDVEFIRRDVADLIEKLQSQFPEVVVLATGRRPEQNAVATLVGSGRIYRFLHKPVSPARAELFLSAATRRYTELHQQEARSILAGVYRLTARTRIIVGGVLVAVATAGAIWLWPQSTTQTISPAPVAETQRSHDEQIATLLVAADAAYAAGKLFAPGDNALDLYRSVLQLDPANEPASKAVTRIVASLEREATAALSSKNIERARAAVAQLQAAAPNHPSLSALQSSIVALSRSATRARVATSAEISQATTPGTLPGPAMPASPATESATPNIDVAKAFLAANQLVEPLDASALSKLREARAADENEGAVQIVATDLGTRLLNRALSLVETGNASDARIAYETALSIDREFETGLPDLTRVGERILELERASSQLKTDALLERAVLLRTSGQLIEPSGDSAVDAMKQLMTESPTLPAVRTEQERLSFALLESTRTSLAAGDIDRADVLVLRAEEISPGLPQARALRQQIGDARAQREEATTVLQATSLPRRREVPAVYPRDALMNQIQGWVDLEFTISQEGVPSAITVKASEPSRTFDAAATLALRQWRFEPIVRDGVPRARRAALRMEFKLKS